MKTLDVYEIQAVSGGLTNDQISYMLVMAAQQVTTFGVIALFTKEALAVKFVLLPIATLAATGLGYDAFNRFYASK